MGTNYYAVDPCPRCGRSKEVHLGKSSAGWRFLIEAHDDLYEDEAGFAAFIRQPHIELRDEYGQSVAAADLLAKIEAKRDGRAQGERFGDADVVRHEFS